MTKAEKLDLIRDSGIIAILRADSPARLIAVADALRRGGVRAIEVTMTTPGALSIVAEAVARFGDDVLFGAGTVLDAETARAAILAGAGLIVAPTLNLQVIRVCNRYGAVAVPGCLTPTEMLAAAEAGADLIKLFPAELGGPAYLRAVRAPLPQLPIVPVGGVTLDNAAEYMAAGAVALGLGSALVSHKLPDGGDFDEITRRAAAFIQAVKQGR